MASLVSVCMAAVLLFTHYLIIYIKSWSAGPRSAVIHFST